MARSLLTTCLTAMLLIAATGVAEANSATRAPRASAHSAHRVLPTRRHAAARRAALSSLAAPDPVTLATSLAERYWGAVPCGGTVAVQADQPLLAGMQASTDGWVTFQSSLGANDLEAPADTYTQCTISLAHWQWPTQARMASDWNMFCLTVVHEMGHLLGHPHSLVPGSVMAPVFTDESSVPAICRASSAQVEASAGGG
jgi:hypothetical protein